MLVATQMRHVSVTHWSLRQYMNMKLIEGIDNEAAYASA